MLYGRTNAAIASRFLKELPEEDIVRKGGYSAVDRAVSQPRYGGWSSESYGSYRKPVIQSYTPPASQKTSAPMLELNKGDMVSHAAFGRGLVLTVVKMGGDALLEIAFDQIGTKKLMAKSASPHMKKL
jgi:DNA helicase-2/ATP-dependent DNA helicase PcrA